MGEFRYFHSRCSMLDKRVTLPTRHSYHTRSNKAKKVKTPGGKLVLHRLSKLGSVPKCRQCPVTLSGIKAARPYQRSQLKKNDRSVSRPYSGVLWAKCVAQNIRRAFFKSEVAIMKKFAAQQTPAASAAQQATTQAVA